MRKQLPFLLFFMAFLSTFSQKTKFVYKAITKETPQPDAFKSAKTFSYELQHDNYKWPFAPNETYPDFNKAAGNVTISGLTKVSSNPDLRIAAGFVGNNPKISSQPIPKQPGKVNKYISLDGFLNIIFLNKNNEVVFEYAQNDHIMESYDPIKLPMKNKNEISVTKARLVNQMVQKFLDKYGHVFSGKAKYRLPFAQLKKAKKGHAVDFDKKNRLLISKVSMKPNNKEYLRQAIDFWNKELDEDFGKMKDKFKYRTLYTNLTSAYILNDQLDEAHQAYDKLQKYTGFFSSPSGYEYAFQSIEAPYEVLNKFQPYKIHELHPTFVYYIKLSGIGYYMKDRRKPNLHKEIKVGKHRVVMPKKEHKKYKFKDIFIQRIIPDNKVRLIELGNIKSKNFLHPYIYPHYCVLHDHKANNRSGIFMDDKPPIIFRYNRNKMLSPYIKAENGQYELYEPLLFFRPKNN